MNHNTLASQTVTQKIDGTNETIEQTWVGQQIQKILWNDYHEIIIENQAYLSSALYLLYWYHRTKNNPAKQNKMMENIYAYFWEAHKESLCKLIEDEELQNMAFEHVEGNILIQPTVDIVISKNNKILSLNRSVFPSGNALVGGFILDEDEDNSLWLDANIFAALRIAWEKIIWGDLIFGVQNEYYTVSNLDKNIKIKLSTQDTKGYKYKDKVTRMVEPSDPRHMVDTHSFKMELEWDIQDDELSWIEKENVMNLSKDKWWFAFGHHRQIIAELTKEKNEINHAENSHHEWVRDIINNPIKNYDLIHKRFLDNNNHPETPCPELFPIVTKMIDDLYSDSINKLCKNDQFALAQRYLVDNALKHCFTEKNNICPYKSTLYAIMDAIKFFDIVARINMNFYDEWATDTFNQQDPRKQQYAYFFNHKYKNHIDQMLAKFPDEIIIPTYEHLWATDLMKVRWIPIRFIGLSNDFIYVDEFWQSPLEFLWHDGDHSLRMAYEDEKYCLENSLSPNELINISTIFWNNLLEKIKIKQTDSLAQKELKKLKKIILFEIVHEDSRPFMKDIITSAIQTSEWRDIHRENIITDPETWYLSRERTVEVQGWISPLSFLLHKLQHGFFDQVDSQISQIVSPKFRTAEYLAQAAYEILIELKAVPEEWVETDEEGNISIEWLLQRICSKSPYKVHNKDFHDPLIDIYWDGTKTDI